MGHRGVLGHEFVGIVERCPARGANGSTSHGAASDWIGQRVTGEINCACGVCPTCQRGDGPHCPNRTTLGIDRRDGALAEYLTLPTRNLHRLPAAIDDRQAVFAEPLAAALEITERMHVRPTEHVIVVGDGKLGLLVAQVLRLTGCALQVVGRHPRKLSILARQGVDVYLESDLEAATQADTVVDCTGHPDGYALARRLVRPRGRLVLKSTFHGDNRLNLTTLVVDEVTLIGSRCGPFAPALRLLEQGLVDVERMIDVTLPLEQGLAAFERARAHGTLKVLVAP
jgi:alcohol dehydrogenase